MTALSTTSSQAAPNLGSLRAGLLARLQKFRAQMRTHLLLEGAATVAAEAVGLALMSFVIDRWLHLSVGLRLTLLTAAVLLLVWESRRLVILPLRVQLSDIRLAALMDRAGQRGGALAARIATVLELPQLLQTDSPPSAAMVDRAVRDGDRSLRDVSLETFLNDDRYVSSLGIVATLLVSSTVIALLAPATSGLWFRRCFLLSREMWPQNTHLLIVGVSDGKLVVPKGEPFTLRVVNGSHSVAPASVWLRYREGQAARVSAMMNRFAPGDFRFEFPSIAENTLVEIGGGDDELDPISIAPVDRPKIVEMQLVSQHPTELQPTIHGFTGQESELSFLPKTKLELTFAAAVPVRQVRLNSSTAVPTPDILRRIDDRHFAISWTHESPVQLQIELVGDADLTSVPTPVAIGLKQDQPPRVSLSYTGVRQRVTPAAHIPLVIQARDDNGVARVDLNVKAEVIDLGKGGPTSLPATAPTTTAAATTETITRTIYGPTTHPTELEVPLQQTLEVSALKLTAGSLLSVDASATDACYLGPQTSRTRVVTFRIVPPEELFKEILLRQQTERVKFRKQIEAAQKIAEALRTMPSAEVAAGLSRDHRLIRREVARTAASLTESIIEMKLNVLGGQEAWDLMDKNILAPLKSLHDDTMSRQREALDQLPNGTGAQLIEAAERQSKIVSTMQEILRQMSQWDSFVDVVNQLNEIIRLETHVKESADQLKKKQTEGIFDP